jgi:hypothetical protein
MTDLALKLEITQPDDWYKVTAKVLYLAYTSLHTGHPRKWRLLHPPPIRQLCSPNPCCYVSTTFMAILEIHKSFRQILERCQQSKTVHGQPRGQIKYHKTERLVQSQI